MRSTTSAVTGADTVRPTLNAQFVDETSWVALCRRLTGHEPPSGLYPRLLEAHAGADRHYHTLDHIAFCLSELEAVRECLESPDECCFALWFHDAVYDPRGNDNEERSADWAARELASVGHSPESIERIRNLILDTRHREPPTSNDGAFLVDIDLAILGQPRERFQAYEEGIRLEYAWVDENRFRQGRSALLQGFLDRPHLFHTEAFAVRYDAQARENLSWAIARLG